ncbi:formate-dependent phosphoribosylglycinamide formyltransferase [Gordonia sp. PP30]|uniref:formate-dependent phosphoribosylglycinamide formyltransferase n=1 Tax=Gordonia sp. PP30 TaxID=2935861 RepID=UPI0024B598FF|nr:formate-dependent phosphoribosylglycinamide formyltransferase [Gordonia sp. PP30]
MTSNPTPDAPDEPAAAPGGPVRAFGTPLSPNAVKVMLLGSGELGKEVVIALQRLGVEVIAVDRYADAPAHQVAHAAEVIDMTDPAAVRAVIEKHRPQYVLPEIEAIATAALVDVENEGLAEVIPSAKGVTLTLDREGIRRLADEELGLPTSSYLFAESEEELRNAAFRVGYPCVVKPVMSSSGKGQSVMRGEADVAASWETAMTGGRVSSTRVIVERFIDFDYEITLLTVRAIDPATGELATYFCEPIGHRQSGGDYVESWQPQPMSEIASGAARSIAARVVTAMAAADIRFSGRGVFGVELFVKGDEVFFSEVSPRPHDTGLVTLSTQRLSEFELHARAVLGLPVTTEMRSPGASAVIYGGLDEPAIRFAGVAEALADPAVDLRLFGKPESFAKRRMGVAVATAPTTDEARRRATRAAGIVVPLGADDPIPEPVMPGASAPAEGVSGPGAGASAPVVGASTMVEGAADQHLPRDHTPDGPGRPASGAPQAAPDGAAAETDQYRAQPPAGGPPPAGPPPRRAPGVVPGPPPQPGPGGGPAGAPRPPMPPPRASRPPQVPPPGMPPRGPAGPRGPRPPGPPPPPPPSR